LARQTNPIPKLEEFKMKVSKYLLMTAVAVAMAFAFAACGGNSTPATPATPPAPIQTAAPPTPAPTPAPEVPVPVNPDLGEGGGDVMDVAEYLAAMTDIIVGFEELVDYVFFLLELMHSIESEDDLLAWAEEFFDAKDIIDFLADALDESAFYAPDEFLHDHLMITAAVTLVYESLVELDFALEAAFLGNYDALMAGVENFMVNMAVAGLLWIETVGGTVDPALLGATWGMIDAPDWIYVFNADHTGVRGVVGAQEVFEWETAFGQILMHTAAGIEHWAYIIIGDLLIFESMQVDGLSFYFARQ
jgi:hypothetical protein